MAGRWYPGVSIERERRRRERKAREFAAIAALPVETSSLPSMLGTAVEER